MKNIRFALKQDDYGILNYGTLVGFFSIAGIVGGFLMPRYMPYGVLDFGIAPLTNAVISIASALFAWSAFCFIRPARYDRHWQIAEFMLVPAFWLLLTLALDVLILNTAHIEDLESILT
jgi:hypothetical protein